MFLKEEGVLSADRVQNAASTLTAISTLPAYAADYRFASLHKHMSQFLEINLSYISHICVYVYIYVYIHIYVHTRTHPMGFLSLENSDTATDARVWKKAMSLEEKLCPI